MQSFPTSKFIILIGPLWVSAEFLLYQQVQLLTAARLQFSAVF